MGFVFEHSEVKNSAITERQLCDHHEYFLSGNVSNDLFRYTLLRDVLHYDQCNFLVPSQVPDTLVNHYPPDKVISCHFAYEPKAFEGTKEPDESVHDHLLRDDVVPGILAA